MILRILIFDTFSIFIYCLDILNTNCKLARFCIYIYGLVATKAPASGELKARPRFPNHSSLTPYSYLLQFSSLSQKIVSATTEASQAEKIYQPKVRPWLSISGLLTLYPYRKQFPGESWLLTRNCHVLYAIWNARWHQKLEKMPPINFPTSVWYECLIHVSFSCLSCTVLSCMCFFGCP